MSDHPLPPSQVLFTNLVIKRLVDEAKTKPDLVHAIADTRLRHSDAGSCARKIGLKAAGYGYSDPMDGPGLWVTHLGHLVHEALQDEIAKRYPNSVMEAVVGWDDLSASGHLDALIEMADGKRVCLELKTMGGFGFDKSVGLNRKAYALNEKGPEGPRVTAKLQGALNALAADADELRIGHISMEAVSKQLAEKINWSDEARIVAEWSYPRSVFEPWAIREKARLSTILLTLERGLLPDRVVVGDDMKPLKLNPQDRRVPWQCAYCPMRERCIDFGPGQPSYER